MSDKIVMLRTICQQAKIEPKVARSRLRDAKRGELPKAVGKRWAWRPGDVSRVRKFLRSA